MRYYSLAKPGIIFGNVVTVAGGFALAAKGKWDPVVFSAALIGLAFVIASGSVFNNYFDRDIDAKMSRTSSRELVVGSVSPRAAIVYAIFLGIAGFAILAVFTNPLTAEVALFGIFAYVILYTVWAKRRSVHGPIVGALSGAVPPVVGYTAAGGRLDAGAGILFLILCLWQMPHFFAIAIRRSEDYAAAGIPVMPLKKGMRVTKMQMAAYIVAFGAAASALFVFGYAGAGYLFVTLVTSAIWLVFSLRGFSAADAILWARGMFFVSLAVLMAVFLAMILGI